jgi:hypothetical protein
MTRGDSSFKFDTFDNEDYQLHTSAFDEKDSRDLRITVRLDDKGPNKTLKAKTELVKDVKPRESKEEREKKKKEVTIGTEKGVGASHRDMSAKEKKCLKKGKKKMKKLEMRGMNKKTEVKINIENSTEDERGEEE